MSLQSLTRSDGSIAVYIDGHLQFDSADEAVYHESLVLPALFLADSPSRILICGGGDGLAARECLRFPGIKRVDIVDLSLEVLECARTEWARFNDHALDDPRTQIHIRDAWDVAPEFGSRDVIVCDFTFPASDADERLFSREWFAMLSKNLTPGGVLAVNAVSPQASPEAFAVLVRTIRAAGLTALPYRVAIPSFREHGYGAWGFVLASHKPISLRKLKTLSAGYPTRQADLGRLVRGGRFSVNERRAFATAPVNSLTDPCFLQVLRRQPASTLEEMPDLNALINALPPGHVTHSREMLLALTESVLGTVRTIDLQRLVDELWERADRLSSRLRDEVERVRQFLQERVFRAELWQQWSAHLFAVLVIVLTIANSISPDQAFGKGVAGLGHASMSRGYAGMERPSSFSKSFESSPAAGPEEAHALTGSGFRNDPGRGPVDIYGYQYRPRTFYYRSYGGWGGGNGMGSYGGNGGYQGIAPSTRSERAVAHESQFVADDDMLVLDNGDIVITLSNDAYLVASEGTVRLLVQDRPEPIENLYANPKMFEALRAQIAGQRASLALERVARQNWLSWVGWTSSMFPLVQRDQTELRNIRTLEARLLAASSRLGNPPKDNLDLNPSPNAIELFVGCYLLADNSVVIYGEKGQPRTLSDKDLSSSNPLSKVIRSVLQKLQKESLADLAQNDRDSREARYDAQMASADLDLYKSILAQNYFDSTYEVDYGTESIGVGDAIRRTQNDISTDQLEVERIELENTRLLDEVARMRQLMERINLSYL